MTMSAPAVRWALSRSGWSRQRGMLIAVAVFAVALLVLHGVSGTGLTYFDISTISASGATLALAAMGETLVILAGGLDLCAGAVISLVNVVLVTRLGDSGLGAAPFTLASIALALGVGTAIGAINGLLVAYVGLQSIIVTLGTMFLAQGAALLILKFPGGTMPEHFSLMLTGDVVREGLPAPIVVLLIAIALWLYLRNTRLGTAIYGLGSDEEAMRANGVDVRRARFLTFMFAGTCYGAAGLFISAQMGGGDPSIGGRMLLQIFAAVVLGGTLIGGGRGGAVGTVFGALTLTTIVSVFLVLGVRTFYTPIVEGVILMLAVLGFSVGDHWPIVSVVSNLRRTMAALRDGSLPSRFKPLDATIALAGFGAAAAAPLPGWLTRNRAALRYALPAYGLFIAALGVTIGLNRGDFSPAEYIGTMFTLGAFLAILGLGQGAVIISGGLDLSVPWTITFPAILVTTFSNGVDGPSVWAVPLALAAGLGIGFLNGAAIVLFGLSPIIVTLAMNGVLEGSALVFSDGAPIGSSPPWLAWFVTGRVGGLAPVGWFLIGFVVVATLLLNRSAFGRRVAAIGNSVTVARLSGVRTGVPTVGVYMLSGLCSAIVGLFLAGFSNQAFFAMGEPYLLSSIAVVVLGGALITGGRGHYLGILGGALLFTGLGIMLSGTVLPEAVRNIIYGLVLLGAVIALRERQSS
jgi:ribose transport system permease protein